MIEKRVNNFTNCEVKNIAPALRFLGYCYIKLNSVLTSPVFDYSP